MSQIISEMPIALEELEKFIIQKNIKRLFIVCGNSYETLSISKPLTAVFKKTKTDTIFFRDFKPNPDYESVVLGVQAYKEQECDAVMAVGGGSAIDVAKCIKLFVTSDDSINFLKQDIVPNSIPFIAIPTTAGTGSESTKFAVIYYEGEKHSVEDKSCIPSFVVLDPEVLTGLSDYQKKSTLLDALSHAVESFWSVNSTEESIGYSKEALDLILDNYRDYLSSGNKGKLRTMLKASNIAGRAINITHTTAGHAMCYKLTSLYKVPHGYAAALCDAELFRYMVSNTDKCADLRGREYLDSMFESLAQALKATSPKAAVDKFALIVNELIQDVPTATPEEIEILTNSVNTERLKNNPVRLEPAVIKDLYKKTLKTK